MALFSYGPGCGVKYPPASSLKNPAAGILTMPTINSLSSPTGPYEATVLSETQIGFQPGLPHHNTSNKIPIGSPHQNVPHTQNSPLLGDCWDKPETMYSTIRRDNHTLKPVPPPTVPSSTPAKVKKTVTICDERDTCASPQYSD